MDKDTILSILGSGGSELQVLKENPAQLTGFLELIETFDQLPEMDRRVSEDGVSLYHAISKGKGMATLEAILAVFFGEPVKRGGEALSNDLTDNLTINYLGGVKEDQTLFLKKIGQGEMYGALFPWQRKVNVITLHLGLYNPVMPDDDFEKLEKLVTEIITQRVSEKLEGGLAGQVQGISLPSFLQMSEMEGSTCSLRIRSGGKTGMLHLLNGSLIDAETDELKHKEAAYSILSWDNPGIEILKAVGRTQNEIKLPLMHLLMDSMRMKDQREFEKDAPPPKRVAKTPLEEKTPSPDQQDDKRLEMSLDTAPPRVAENVPPPELEMWKQTVGSGSTDITPEKESPDGKTVGPGPIEQKPFAPPKKITAGNVPIDDTLIHKDESGPAKRRQAGTTRPVLKPKKKFPMLAGLALLVLCVAGFFIYRTMMGDRTTSDYQRLMTTLSNLKDGDEQEKLLMAFINTHEPGEDTTRAEMKLQEVWVQNEEANYQKTIDAVNKMPIDQAFEENARALYARFLEKYPNTQHAEDIQRAVSEISGLTEDIVFSNLKNLGAKDYTRKIGAYKNYLSLYPRGKYRESVNQMFSETLGESYMNFKRAIAICERDAAWDKCLAICDDYLVAFSGYLDTGEIETIRNRMKMQQDYLVLKTRTAGVADETARPIYMAYMASYPDSPNNEEIQKEIRRMNLDVTAGRQWASLKKSVQGGGLSLQTKIDKIETYISKNNTSRYMAEARQILDDLEKEADKLSARREQNINSMNEEEKAKKEADERYAVLVKRQAEHARIAAEKKKALAALNETRGRFVPTGENSVTDQKTGLMWSLLDSQRELGVCMDHRAATRYVKELRHDGYDDWRLPTSAELAGIYKNKPYFPDSGAEWYWTSEIFAKGYSYIVNTVSAKQETVFKKDTQDIGACGVVRAVRP